MENMIKLVVRVLVTALALLIVARIIPGIEVDGLYAAVIAAVVLGVVNLIVRPVLVVLTLPVTILTLGLFIFIINAALFGFVASFIDGFSVDGFIPALLGSLLVSIISTIGTHLLSE
jgi:putative membrane protein